MMYEVKMPILGFESIQNIDLTQIDEFFVSVRNTQGDIPSFTLINPYVLREYSFDIPMNVQQALGITENSRVLVYSMVVLQNPIENSTVNFLAPLIFNEDTKTMGQMVLESNRYPDFAIADPISTYFQK